MSLSHPAAAPLHPLVLPARADAANAHEGTTKKELS